MIKQNYNSNNEDRRLLLWLSMAGIITAILSLIINSQLNVELPLMIITYTGIIVYSILLIMIRKGININLSQNLLVYITLAFTNFLWYFEYGHEGPVLFFFVVLFTLIIFIWNGRKLIIGSLILTLNLIACFYIDYQFPDFVSGYPDDRTQTIDIYTSLLMFGIIMYALMLAVKKSYAREYEKALQSDKLKTSFLENISHEVRTPLNAIVGFSSLLNDDKLSKEQRDEYNSLITDSNETLLRVIDDVLQVSLMETDQLMLNINDCDLSKVLEGLFKTYSKILIKNSRPEINLSISDSNINCIVKTDKIRLQQVLINLLDNALKFTQSGSISFGFRIEDDNIIFQVSDTGIGIKTKHHDNIFDRFYKVEGNSDELYRGTGIGLFLTKKIVESLGGDVWVVSSFGDGAAFYFTIPKIGCRKIEDRQEKEIPVEKTYNLKGKKILVVEDQPSSQIFFKNMLKKSGIEVLQAWDGTEGIELAKNLPDIDLILMDLRLPMVSGYEAFEEIRKFNPNVPIIAQTAFGMKSDEKACLKAGFNDYISKPIKTSELLLKISDALG